MIVITPRDIFQWLVVPLAIVTAIHLAVWFTVSYLAWDFSWMSGFAHRTLFLSLSAFIWGVLLKDVLDDHLAAQSATEDETQADQHEQELSLLRQDKAEIHAKIRAIKDRLGYDAHYPFDAVIEDLIAGKHLARASERGE